MTLEKFQEEFNRMCESFTICVNCPCYVDRDSEHDGYCGISLNIEDLIFNVMQWVNNNAIKEQNIKKGGKNEG